MREIGFSPDDEPKHESQRRQPDDRRHEHRSDTIGYALHGSLAALRLLYHAYDPREQRVGAGPGRPQHERASAVDRSDNRPVAGLLIDGQRLAGNHALVDERFAAFDRAVDRNPLPGTHRHEIPCAQCRYRNVPLDAAGQQAGGRRLQSHQLLDSRRGASLGPLLEQLAQQDESYDHAGGLVIDMRFQPPLGPEPGIDRIEQTEQKGDRRAERDQRIHVGLSVTRLLPPAYEKHAPEHAQHRQRQRQHDPVAVGHVHERHGDQHERQRESPCSDRIATQPAIARTLGLLALLLAVALVDDQVVAGRPNGIADLNGRDRPGVERDRQRVRSEIDGSLADSLQMPDRLLDMVRAGRAAHFEHRKLFSFDVPCHDTFFRTTPKDKNNTQRRLASSLNIVRLTVLRKLSARKRQSTAVWPLRRQAAANSDLSDSIVSRTLVIFFDI